jgi:hypothetical protein
MQPADPATRRRVVIAVLAIVVVAVAGGYWLEGWIAELQAGDPAEARAKLGRALIVGAWVASLPALAFAAQLWWNGVQVRKLGRFPLPTAKLLRATPIITGNQARARGAAFQVLAVILAVLVAGVLVTTHRLVARLAQPAASNADVVLSGQLGQAYARAPTAIAQMTCGSFSTPVAEPALAAWKSPRSSSMVQAGSSSSLSTSAVSSRFCSS